MLELYHFTPQSAVASILIHGLFPSGRFHDLGLQMRRNVVYCWLSPDDDRMGYGENAGYECLRVLVEPERCLVADMDLATVAYQHMRGVGAKDRDPEQARQYAERYHATAVPAAQYRPGLFTAPEVLVSGPVRASQLAPVTDSALPLAEGQQVQITARRFDGTPYRWWEARVEKVTSDCVVTYVPAGGLLHQPGGDWQSPVSVRTFYWADRHYNLCECYAASDEGSSLYVHIASPPQFATGVIDYRDFELDVSKFVGKPAVVLDEDEFEAAAVKYGYSQAFQADCRSAVAEALSLVDRWIWTYR
ncbi:MAG: hypothetical protein K0R39_3888 [Symbiobacteriaceae bacterium]|jgi:protein associated with RNAse G/E|nr:hypothetical protein [Symbiobacteriaceae bacterium]